MYPDPSVTDRLPPHNRDAERSLLGSMLRDNQVIPEAVNLVKAEHFYVYGHQKIYEAITKLNDDAGKRFAYLDVSKLLLTEQIEKYIDHSIAVYGVVKTTNEGKDLVIQVESLQLK